MEHELPLDLELDEAVENLTLDDFLDKPKELRFKNPIDFSLYIEKYSQEHGVGLLSAIITYCEEEDVDFHDIPRLLTKSLKDKLEKEACAERFMRNSNGVLNFGEDVDLEE